MTRLWHDQRGDTLIEVIIATIIIGTVLFGAYSLSTKAFQLNQSARERSQAAQLLQQQAEALRSLRDKSSDWNSFKSQVQGVNVSAFHVIENGNGRWQAISNSADDPDGDGLWQPGCTSPCGPGQDASVATYYELKIEGSFENNPNNPVEQDKFKAKITIKWPRLGSGDEETSELYLNLVNRQLPLVSYHQSESVRVVL